jgi:2'-5' RNA ligase
MYDRLGPEMGGHRPPRPTPNPHLTVARRVDRGLLDGLRQGRGPTSVRWTADRILLFRSHLGPPGARYEPIFSAPLGDRVAAIDGDLRRDP